MSTVSPFDAGERVADAELVHAYADALTDLAIQHGITNLRFASPGRLVGTVDPHRDLMDVAAFDVAATDLLGAVVMLFSDRVLAKPHVSPDLVSAQPL